MRLTACLLLIAAPAFAQVPPGWRESAVSTPKFPTYELPSAPQTTIALMGHTKVPAITLLPNLMSVTRNPDVCPEGAQSNVEADGTVTVVGSAPGKACALVAAPDGHGGSVSWLGSARGHGLNGPALLAAVRAFAAQR